ncbi:hypothetical protein E4U24_002182 [Claviceps purpurea]|nr:hypothetical protein E4U24_002182 [Claviceps purpurea]
MTGRLRQRHGKCLSAAWAGGCMWAVGEQARSQEVRLGSIEGIRSITSALLPADLPHTEDLQVADDFVEDEDFA